MSVVDADVSRSSDCSEVEAFLDVLWPLGIPTEGRVTVAFQATERRGWTALQFSTVSSAAAALTSAPDRYLTCGAIRPLRRERGGEADVVALPGLWMDIDIADGKHKKRELPPTVEDAREMLRGLPQQPSVIVRSGGGIHAWWLLEEPWLLTDRSSRLQAKAISLGFQKHLLAIGNARGWDLDLTADLARCLRSPGTLNGKYDPPRRVVRIDAVERMPCVRYTPKDFESYADPTRTSERSVARPRPNCPSRGSSWVGRAGELLGGIQKTLDDEHGGGVVIEVCPACLGRESPGTIAEGTAHLCRLSGVLRCKRASCEASESHGGLAFEVWTKRYTPASTMAELRVLRAKDAHARPALSDDGNALRLARRHGADLRWSDGLGWFEWDGRRYRAISSSRSGQSDGAIDLAREAVRAIRTEADDPQLTDSEREAIRSHAHASQSEKRLRSMVALARCELGTRSEEFDRDPWLLNVENGTLDLKRGELRPHDRGDLLTKLAPVAYDPDARSDDLERFVAHLTGGAADFRAYLERLIGYTVAGEKSEDLIALLLGRGGTGKSTLLEALASMLGEYAAVIPFDALRARESASAPRPELAATRGARLVTASEVREGMEIDAALLKSLSGGDTLNVRGLFRDPMTFRPTFTLWLAANHPPALNRMDSGARRRLAVLPFDREVPSGTLDLELRLRLRHPTARRALLAMAVRGCLAWKQAGQVGCCRAVDDAKLRYWEGDMAETLLKFVDEICVRAPDAWTTTAAVRSALEGFAKERQARLPADRQLAECLRLRGFEKADRGGARGWRLRLLPRATEETP